MQDIKTVLQSLGYRLRDDGAKYWRALPLYRASDNSTALRISKQSGAFVDFVENINGPFSKLVQLTLGLVSLGDAEKWLDQKDFKNLPVASVKPRVIMSEVFDKEMLNKLIKDYTYWNRKAIKSDVVEKFMGGVAIEGRMANRYVFPIFDRKERMIGFAGRDLTDKHTIKWKLIGEKSKWAFPLHLNRDNIVACGEVILVESVGDLLKMSQAGFDNCLCLFGTYLSDRMISTLAGLSLDKILIGTNNDANNKNIGNKKAVEIYGRLSHFIDRSKIQIKLPTKKDFGEMTEEEILTWKGLSNFAVVGGRDFKDQTKLNNVLDEVSNMGMIVSGGAIGADKMGVDWAKEQNIPYIEFLPDWDKYGKVAGHIRNEPVVRNADKVIAFWDGKSTGTADAIDKAKKLNKDLEIVSY